MKNWIQNPYDIFYLNYKIVSQFKDIKKVITTFSKIHGNFKNEYRGFLYYLEILIIQTSYQLELLIADRDLFERIRWGNNTLDDPEFKNFLLTHHEGIFLIRLNSIRRDLSSLREKFDENKIQEKLSELNNLFFEIDSSLKKKHVIKRMKDSKKSENIVVVDHLVRYFNWFRFESTNPEDAFDVDKEVPIYPGDLISYLISNKQRKNYFLQDPRIANNNSDYLNGYQNTLVILYSQFYPAKKTFFKRLFDGVSNWTGLQYCYSQIVDELILTLNFQRQMFELVESSNENNKIKEQIADIEELRQILRNREIRFFQDFYKDYTLISQYLFGAVSLCNKGLRQNLEVIQFDVIDCKKSEKLAYYAIFNPFRGGFWDGSYWIFFESPYGYGDPDEMKKIIDDIHHISSQPIRFTKIKISEKIIKDYYLQKDQEGQKKNRDHEIIKSSRGLLGEFLTLFYLIKKYDINKIIDIECHSDIQKTDIDVLIETKDSIIIAQVKSFFYFNFKENEKIVNNFNQISKKFLSKHKKIEKILVFMDSEIHDSEINVLINEKLAYQTEFAITENDEEDRRQKITNNFKKTGINVMYRSDILEQLKLERKNAKLIDSIETIFSRDHEDHD